MPSQTAAAALIELYYAVEGAPWCWQTWKELSGVHCGLFPVRDDELPSGWSREDANDIRSWFIHCHSASTDQQNGAASMPGRAKWSTFVNNRWENWRIHIAVVKALRDCSVHPIQLIVNEGTMQGEWPKADSYASNAFESIGLAIFGTDCLGQGELCPANVRRCIGAFTQRSWARIRSLIQKDMKRKDLLEAEALAAFKRAYSYFITKSFFACSSLASRSVSEIDEGMVTRAKIIAAMRLVSRWKDISELYSMTEDLEKASHMVAEVERLLDEVAVAVHGHTKPEPEKSAGCEPKPSKRVLIISTPLRTDEIYRVICGKRQGIPRPGNGGRPHGPPETLCRVLRNR